MINHIIAVVGGSISLTLGLMGIFKKSVMDKLGFEKVTKKQYLLLLIIGALLLLLTFLMILL